MRSILAYVATVIMLVVAPPVWAQDLSGEVAIEGPRSSRPLSETSLYWIRYTCSNEPGIPTTRPVRLPGSSFTHGFYLSKGAVWPTKEIASRPAGMLASQVLFILEPGKTDYRNPTCGGSMIVRGSDDPHIFAFFATGQDVNDDVLKKFGDLAQAAVPLLSTLFTGRPLAEDQTSLLGDLTTSLDKFGQFAKEFEFDNFRSSPVRLGVGTYYIKSRLTTVKVEVTKEDSLLLGSAPFRHSIAALGESVTAIPASALSDAAALEQACASLATDWENLGVRHRVDLAYIKFMALNALRPSTQQIVQCLGEADAKDAQGYQDIFQIQPALQYSESDIGALSPPDRVTNENYGVQPHGAPWLSDAIHTLIKGSVALANGERYVPRDLEEYMSLFAPEVTIQDEVAGYPLMTAAGVMDDDRLTIKPSEIAGLLARMPAKDWGCFAETGSDKGNKYRSRGNEAVVLLAWTAKGRKDVDADTIKGVRVFFEDDKIRHLIFTDAISPSGLIAATDCSVTIRSAQTPEKADKPALSAELPG